ncbi:MAG: hypothetical protein ACE361_26100 [Aureliella sp.]
MQFDRRRWILGTTGLTAAVGTSNVLGQSEEDSKPKEAKETPPAKGPREAEFTRDYDPPGFKPSWKNEQVNRSLAQDFVIFAHSDLKMVEKLLAREPNLLNAAIDWGNGDFETALGGASHMGRKDIVEYLLSKGARMDLFCATMMGMLDVVKAMLTLEPKLIDARGPHGFSLHFHAQVGQDTAKPVLDYLQSIKEIELRPVPFLKKKPAAPKEK